MARRFLHLHSFLHLRSLYLHSSTPPITFLSALSFPALGFGVWGLGFGVKGLGFRGVLVLLGAVLVCQKVVQDENTIRGTNTGENMIRGTNT